MAVLPPGESAADFNRAIRRFKEAVGVNWAFEDEDAALETIAVYLSRPR